MKRPAVTVEQDFALKRLGEGCVTEEVWKVACGDAVQHFTQTVRALRRKGLVYRSMVGLWFPVKPAPTAASR